MRSSVSARNGRFIALSVHGDSPFIPEIMARRSDSAWSSTTTRQRPVAPWMTGGHGRLRILAYGLVSSRCLHEAEARRVLQTPSDEASFRALDLICRKIRQWKCLCPVGEMRACFVKPEALPGRSGPCFIGLDIGEATSGTAAVAVWPENGRVETWLAFGDVPSLNVRSRRDNADYAAMVARGELKTYPGRIVRPDAFLGDLLADLEGAEVELAAADSYRDSEMKDFSDRAGIPWEIQYRRVGAGKDGGRDVRAFQRLVNAKRLTLLENLSLVTAISKAAIRRDGNGNPGLSKASSNGRIDVLSAAIIAAGLAEPHFDRTARPAWRYTGL